MIRYFTDYSKGGASFVLTVTVLFASLWTKVNIGLGNKALPMAVRAPVLAPSYTNLPTVSGAMIMALIDRLGRDAEGNMHIASHEWSAGLALYALGIANRAKLITEFALGVDDEPQLDALLATIDILDADGKAKYHGKIESLNIFLEKGSITNAQYKILLGF